MISRFLATAFGPSSTWTTTGPEIIEQIAFEARGSEFIDQKSGVSARLTISAMEALISNAERRAVINGDEIILPRMTERRVSQVVSERNRLGEIFVECEGPSDRAADLGNFDAVREPRSRYHGAPFSVDRQACMRCFDGC